MQIFLKIAYHKPESSVRFGEILHIRRRYLRPPAIQMSRSEHEWYIDVSVGYLDLDCIDRIH